MSSKPFKIKSQQEGLIILDLPKEKRKLTPFVVFIRPGSSDFEIIARGKIEAVQDNNILVSLVRDSIIKYPLSGDLAVSLGSPKDWPPETDPSLTEPPLQAEEADLPPDPGYIEITYGLTKGLMNTSSSDSQSNEYKDVPQYSLSRLSFAWYFDFFWRLGIEYESSSGKVPTSTYYRNSGNSSAESKTLSLNYRFRKRWFNKSVRPVLRLVSLTDVFTTLNPDEALISSSLTANGLGARFSYERDSLVWKSESKFGFKFVQAYLDTTYFPIVAVSDTGVISRGTSSGSNGYELKLGLVNLVQIGWIPWFKRYSLEVGFLQRSMNLKFGGATKSEVGGFYTVPEGLSSQESSQLYYVSIGMRFEDYIGQLFKPR